MTKTSSKLLVLLIVLVFSVFVFTTEILASNSEDIAAASIEGAENVLVSAYQVVLEAEQVGANVSGLLAQLNEAGELLAEAQVAFRLGDFDEVVLSANNCSEIGENVKIEADELRIAAYGSRITGFWFTMTGSMVGVVAVGFGSFWSWRVFKRRYYTRALKMKPGVVKDES